MLLCEDILIMLAKKGLNKTNIANYLQMSLTAVKNHLGYYNIEPEYGTTKVVCSKEISLLKVMLKHQYFHSICFMHTVNPANVIYREVGKPKLPKKFFSKEKIVVYLYGKQMKAKYIADLLDCSVNAVERIAIKNKLTNKRKNKENCALEKKDKLTAHDSVLAYKLIQMGYSFVYLSQIFDYDLNSLYEIFYEIKAKNVVLKTCPLCKTTQVVYKYHTTQCKCYDKKAISSYSLAEVGG